MPAPGGGVPGVSVETVDLLRPRIERLRTDIAGFAGYAERGPLFHPVRLQTWRQFLDSFGPPLVPGHVGEAVRLFFENGGEACHMVRIADPDPVQGAAAARAAIPLGPPGAPLGTLHLRAAFAAIGAARAPGEGPGPGPTGAPGAGAEALENPGSWGNRLSVVLRAALAGHTTAAALQPGDGASTRVAGLAGFVPGSLVRLLQDGRAAPRLGRVRGVDTGLGEILWHHPLAGPGFGSLDPARPMRLESLALSLELLLDGVAIERHEGLSLSPDHPQSIAAALAARSPWLAARIEAPDAALEDPELWDFAGLAQPFSGGRDGLRGVTKAHLFAGLDVLARVDEVSLLALPDLVLAAEPPAPPQSFALPDRPCQRMEVPPAGRLSGRVLDADTGRPVAGARITGLGAAAAAAAVLSGADGRFVLSGLPAGQVALRLVHPAYGAAEASGQSFPVAMAQAQDFILAPVVLPPRFDADTVAEVQAAMAAQGERGLYRVAILDLPQGAAARIEDVIGWRRRFDTSHAALYWPWLRAIRADGSLVTLPPSGAVAGLIARMDLAEGPQRAPANRPLSGIAGLDLPVTAAEHALLNEAGVNVIRASPGRGIAPQGARTLSSEPELRFLNVRRLLLMIAEAIEDAHQWAVFEPNDRRLRDAVTQSLTAFLAALWRQGAFAGASPAEAFRVKCDEENNPPAIIDAGRMVAQIAVAPVRPYEFIRLRLGRAERLSVQVEERR